MDKADLLKLSIGAFDSLFICRISLVVASAFDANTIEVKLARSTLNHIEKTHPDMFPDDILLLSDAIKGGLIIKEDRRPFHLSCAYQHPTIEKYRYIAGLKFAAGNHELWVSTFHRAKPRQTRSLLARGTILKRHF